MPTGGNIAYADAFSFPLETEVSYDRRYVKAMDEAFAETDLDELRAYLRATVMVRYAADGDQASREARRWFEQTVLLDIPENWVFAQWAQCVDRADAWLPELLGQYYAQLELPPESRALAQQIAEGVRAGFAARIERDAWLAPAARALALEKLGAVTMRVGHPDLWRDYGDVELSTTDHLANVIQLARLELRVALFGVGRRGDEEAWPSSIIDANASYLPIRNSIALNAGILQWPLFQAERAMVANFGGIGAIVGHELGHAFDADAIDLDAQGGHKEWLSGRSRAAYERGVACVVADLDTRRGREGIAVIGDLARDEAIADLAGVQAAHAAWRTWARVHPSESPAIPGLTDEQVLFLTFAQAHCRNGTAAYERVQSITDTHAESAVRVNATLAHVPAFAEAFSCESGTPMHPVERCEVW